MHLNFTEKICTGSLCLSRNLGVVGGTNSVAIVFGNDCNCNVQPNNSNPYVAPYTECFI